MEEGGGEERCGVRVNQMLTFLGLERVRRASCVSPACADPPRRVQLLLGEISIYLCIYLSLSPLLIYLSIFFAYHSTFFIC
jgi:hypothetical protein